MAVIDLFRNTETGRPLLFYATAQRLAIRTIVTTITLLCDPICVIHFILPTIKNPFFWIAPKK